MSASKVIGLDAYLKQLKKELTDYGVETQTAYLLEYAPKKCQEIGLKISSYNSKHHMDDTGNLLDSLCWGVSYKGSMKGCGFYRSQRATVPSSLHEFSRVSYIEKSGLRKGKWNENMDASENVYGHAEAEEFLNSYHSRYTKGWQVFFAIMASYWGYWESGFDQKGKGGVILAHHKFAVMTELWDELRMTPNLKANLTVNPKMRYTSFKLKRIAEKNDNG